MDERTKEMTLYLCVSSKWKRSLETGHITEKENKYFLIDENQYDEWQKDPPVPDEDYSGGSGTYVLCVVTKEFSSSFCDDINNEKLNEIIAGILGRAYEQYNEATAEAERTIRIAKENAKKSGLVIQ